MWKDEKKSVFINTSSIYSYINQILLFKAMLYKNKNIIK